MYSSRFIVEINSQETVTPVVMSIFKPLFRGISWQISVNYEGQALVICVLAYSGKSVFVIVAGASNYEEIRVRTGIGTKLFWVDSNRVEVVQKSI